MYIETIPRRLGGLGRHLMDTGRGSNERVIVRADLSRDLPADVTLALRLLAAPARRVRRMKREVVHIVISPQRMLSADELEHVLRTIETEYGIPEGSARLLVEHQKGKRARHYHVVYSMASEVSGRALRFTRSGDRDEMLARRLEIELGEQLQPSTRVARTVELLRERKRDDLAEIAAQGPVAEKGRRQSKDEVRQDARLGVDRELVDARLLEAWRQANGDLSRLRSELDAMGFRLAAGDERIAGVPIVQLIDIETLKSTSLTRHLNRLRVVGDGPRLREAAIGASMGELPPMHEVKAQLRKDAPERSADALLGEYDRLVAEMDADGEREEAIKARKGRARLATRLTAEEQKDLRERQKLVRERYRHRDRIRRARVNRSFIAAKLFAGPEIRKAAFYLVAIGVLATGAGLIPALAAAGVAVAAIPSYSGAKRRRVTADLAARQDRTEMSRELREEARSFFRERALRQKTASREAQAERVRLRIHRNRRRVALKPQVPPPVSGRAVQRSPGRRRGGPER
ncbi:MAG: hypothetical protein GY844_10895 [Bradyrhizobium sp.]|uniref:hypothetical protein n=1 Tax=Bosea sp. (in: a-proteobacteria) TaxID=1871050 RepID=UPI00239C5980|nr:hypothetical protein [Bradyrhizobium sp.]MCP4738275.1 hypothetical protein [Bosea sp. (in: a-proteobacteria)]